MNQNFYTREQEARQQNRRQRAQVEKHQTLEMLQIEQHAAQEGIPSALGEQENPRPGFLGRLKRLILKKS
jgi:hypothetical protein